MKKSNSFKMKFKAGLLALAIFVGAGGALLQDSARSNVSLS